MKTIRLFVFGAVLLWAVPLFAPLPPDAAVRKKDILQYRLRAMAEYEQQQEDRGKERIRSRAKMLVDMEKPPRVRSGEPAALLSETDAVAEADRAHKKIRRILISIMSLALIIGGAGWVWYKTRETDE